MCLCLLIYLLTYLLTYLLVYPLIRWMTVCQLDELRALVRSPLTKTGRQILSALIVIEVHARDVVTNMVDQEVCNVNDFEWISQLRSVLSSNRLCVFGLSGAI